MVFKDRLSSYKRAYASYGFESSECQKTFIPKRLGDKWQKKAKGHALTLSAPGRISSILGSRQVETPAS